jgi:hypothetical protein
MAGLGGFAWLQVLRSLRGSLVDVFRAELDTLGRELSSSARRLGGALLLLFFATGVALFSVGALAFAGIAALSLKMPAWAAALIVFGVLLLVAALLAYLGARQLRSIESPATTVKRRVADHLDWWRFRIRRGRSARAPSPYSRRPEDPWRDDSSY